VDNQCLICPELAGCQSYVEYERTEAMEGISKDTFQKMDVESKLDVLFDYVHEIHQGAPKRVRDRDKKCAKQIAICYDRFGDLEEECETAKDNFQKVLKVRMFLNTTASLVGGFIGGFMAVWSAFKLGMFL
jgi:hypothetical protein